MALEERWVDVDDVAAHLGVAKDSIYRWVESKGFPAHRVGRLLRFKLSEVDKWVQRGASNKTSTASSETSKCSSTKGKSAK